MSHEVHDSKHAEKANCRNAANGLMKRKDGVGESRTSTSSATTRRAPCPRRRSSSAPRADRSPFSDEVDKVAWLRRMGFETSPQEIFPRSPEEVVDYRARVMDRRRASPSTSTASWSREGR